MAKKAMEIEYELPEDVLMDVLSRVPAKSLLRCKSVSKYWYSLILNPIFISLHRTRAQPYYYIKGDLFGRLEISWPDLTNGIEQDFWKRQWDRHGGCSETTYDQMAFLTLAADLNDKHDILSSLLAANLARHTSAKLQDFKSAIKYHTTKLPDLACVWVDNTLWKLWEVRICYDSSTLEIIDCPPNPQYGRNCAARSDDIFFP